MLVKQWLIEGPAAGATAAQSIYVLPVLKLASPSLFAQQFADLIVRTERVLRPLGAISSVAFALSTYLSWSQDMASGQWYLLALATIVCFGITPFTLIKLKPYNNRVKQIAKNLDAGVTSKSTLGSGDQEEMLEIVEIWMKTNYIRCLFPVCGAAIALWTLIG